MVTFVVPRYLTADLFAQLVIDTATDELAIYAYHLGIQFPLHSCCRLEVTDSLRPACKRVVEEPHLIYVMMPLGCFTSAVPIAF